MGTKKEIRVCKCTVDDANGRSDQRADVCDNCGGRRGNNDSLRNRIRRRFNDYFRRGRVRQEVKQREVQPERSIKPTTETIRKRKMKIGTVEILHIMPQCQHAQTWVRPLSQAMEKFGISDNVQRAATFLAQVAHESSQMNRLQENLSYSRSRLRQVWPSRFPDDQSTFSYGRNPERLANKVYANRMGNGAEQVGDGFRYRGRGLLQITGRDNYAKIGRLINLPSLVETPDHLIEPRWAAMSAAAYWSSRNLNEVADRLTEDDMRAVVSQITKLINGGTHGLDQRLKLTQRALQILDTGFTV